MAPMVRVQRLVVRRKSCVPLPRINRNTKLRRLRRTAPTLASQHEISERQEPLRLFESAVVNQGAALSPFSTCSKSGYSNPPFGSSNTLPGVCQYAIEQYVNVQLLPLPTIRYEATETTVHISIWPNSVPENRGAASKKKPREYLPSDFSETLSRAHL